VAWADATSTYRIATASDITDLANAQEILLITCAQKSSLSYSERTWQGYGVVSQARGTATKCPDQVKLAVPNVIDSQVHCPAAKLMLRGLTKLPITRIQQRSRECPVLGGSLGPRSPEVQTASVSNDGRVVTSDPEPPDVDV
jgi:hypothetical protein